MSEEVEKKLLQTQHELHFRKAETVCTAQNDLLYYAIKFDLEKVLPFLKLTTSTPYYKRNMYLYNLGCHKLNTDLVYMYTWDEILVSPGLQEISSCVTKHLLLQSYYYGQ